MMLTNKGEKLDKFKKVAVLRQEIHLCSSSQKRKLLIEDKHVEISKWDVDSIIQRKHAREDEIIQEAQVK